MWILRGLTLIEALPYIDKWLQPSRKREQYLAWRERCAVKLARLAMFHVAPKPGTGPVPG